MRLLITVVYCLIVIHGSSSVPGLSGKQAESSSAQASDQGTSMKNEGVEDAYGQIADKGNQISLLTNIKIQNITHNTAINPLQKDTGIGNYHSNVLKNRVKSNENSNENTDSSVSRETNGYEVVDESFNNDGGKKEIVLSRSKREVKKPKKTVKIYRYESQPIRSRFSYIQKVQKLYEPKEVVESKILTDRKKIVTENHTAQEEHNSEENEEHNSRTTSHLKINKKKRKSKKKRGSQGTIDDSEENEDEESSEEADTGGSSIAKESDRKMKNNNIKSTTVVQPNLSVVAIRNATQNSLEETKRNKIVVENKSFSSQTAMKLKKNEKKSVEANESKYLHSNEISKVKTEKLSSSTQQSANTDLLYKGTSSQSSIATQKSTDIRKSNTQSESMLNVSKTNKQLSRQNILSAGKTIKSDLKNSFKGMNSLMQTAAEVETSQSARKISALTYNKNTDINTKASTNLAREKITEFIIRDNKSVSSSTASFKSENEETNHEIEMDNNETVLKARKGALPSVPNNRNVLNNVPFIQKSITATANRASDEQSESLMIREAKRVGGRDGRINTAFTKSPQIITNRPDDNPLQTSLREGNIPSVPKYPFANLPIVPKATTGIQNSRIVSTSQSSKRRTSDFVNTSKKILSGTSVTNLEEENSEINKNVEFNNRFSVVKVNKAAERSKTTSSSEVVLRNAYENIETDSNSRKEFSMKPNVQFSQPLKVTNFGRQQSKADRTSKVVSYEKYTSNSEEENTAINNKVEYQNKIGVFNVPKGQRNLPSVPIAPNWPADVSTGSKSTHIIQNSENMASTKRAQTFSRQQAQKVTSDEILHRSMDSEEINTEANNNYKFQYNKNSVIKVPTPQRNRPSNSAVSNLIQESSNALSSQQAKSNTVRTSNKMLSDTRIIDSEEMNNESETRKIARNFQTISTRPNFPLNIPTVPKSTSVVQKFRSMNKGVKTSKEVLSDTDVFDREEENSEINKHVENDYKNKIIEVSKTRENLSTIPGRAAGAPLQPAFNREPESGRIATSLRKGEFNKFTNEDSSTSSKTSNFNSNLNTQIYNREQKESIVTTAEESKAELRNFARNNQVSLSSNDANFMNFEKKMSEMNHHFETDNSEHLSRVNKFLRNPFPVPIAPNLLNNFPTGNRPTISSNSLVTRKSELERAMSKENLDWKITQNSNANNRFKSIDRNTKENSNEYIDNNKKFNTVVENTPPIRSLPRLSQYISDLHESITNLNNRLATSNLQSSLNQKIFQNNPVSTSMDIANEHNSERINSEMNIDSNKHLNQAKTIDNLSFVSKLSAEKISEEIKNNLDSLFEKFGLRNSRKTASEDSNQFSFRKVPQGTNSLPYVTTPPSTIRNWPVSTPLRTATRIQEIEESKNKAVSTSMESSYNSQEDYFRKRGTLNSEKSTKEIHTNDETDFKVQNSVKYRSNPASLRPFGSRANVISAHNERDELNSEENRREDNTKVSKVVGNLSNSREIFENESVKRTASQESYASTNSKKYSREINNKLAAFMNQHDAISNRLSVSKVASVADNLLSTFRNAQILSPSQISTIRNQNLATMKNKAVATSMEESNNSEEKYMRKSDFHSSKKETTEIDNNTQNIRSQNLIKNLVTNTNVPKTDGNLPALSMSQSRFENSLDNALSQRSSSKTTTKNNQQYLSDFTKSFSNSYNTKFNAITEAVSNIANSAKNLLLFKPASTGKGNISTAPETPTTQRNRIFNIPSQPSFASFPKLSKLNGESLTKGFSRNFNEDLYSNEVRKSTETFFNQHRAAGNLHSVQALPGVTRSPTSFGNRPFIAPLQTSPLKLTNDERSKSKFASLNTESLSRSINSNENVHVTEDYDSTKTHFNQAQLEGHFTSKAADNLNAPETSVASAPKYSIPYSKGFPSSQDHFYSNPYPDSGSYISGINKDNKRFSRLSESEKSSFISKSQKMQGSRLAFVPSQLRAYRPEKSKFKNVPSFPNLYHDGLGMQEHASDVEDDISTTLNTHNFGINRAFVSKMPKLAGGIHYVSPTPMLMGHWPVHVPPQPSVAMYPKFRRPKVMAVPHSAGVYYPHTHISQIHSSGNFFNAPHQMGFLSPPRLPPSRGPKLQRINNGIIPIPQVFPHYISNGPSVIGRVQPIHKVPTTYYIPHHLHAPMVVGKVMPSSKVPFGRKPHGFSIPSPPIINLRKVRSGLPKNTYIPSPKKNTGDFGMETFNKGLPSTNHLQINEHERVDMVELEKRAGKTVWGIPIRNAAGKVEYLTVGNREGEINLITSTDLTGRVRHLYRTKDETGRYHNLLLKTTGGYLSLVEADYSGGQHSTGFIGYDEAGEYVVPIHFEEDHLVIDPYVHSVSHALNVHPANEIVKEVFYYKK